MLKKSHIKGLAVAAALFAGMMTSASAIAAGSLQGSTEIDRPSVLKGSAEPIYVLINLKATRTESPDNSDRPALNLGLVLDRSGSMSDAGKIEYLKDAAKLTADQIGPKDFLSLVEYDDRITVMWPSAKVESPFVVKRLIDGLAPRGSTNLAGGMMRGVDEVYGQLRDGDFGDEGIHRVMLLSDGLANVGVTDHGEIAKLVREARKKGVRISTLGLGRDYDEDLMQLIAENGGGHYYYIENPAQMPRIFEEELQTAFETVAKDVSIEIDIGRKFKSVEIVSFDETLTRDDNEADLADFYSGETRTLILRFEPKESAFSRRGTVDLGDIDIDYRDLETGKMKEISWDLEVKVTNDAKRAEAELNKNVVVETTLLEVERKQKVAIELYEKGEKDKADGVMKDIQGNLAGMTAYIDDDRLKRKSEALEMEQQSMDEAVSSPAAKASYLKRSKQRLYEAKSGKRTLSVLKEGDKGLAVENLQKALKDKGHFNGDIDGIFSSDLKTALEAFQTAEGLTVDGVAGPATLKALGLY